MVGTTYTVRLTEVLPDEHSTLRPHYLNFPTLAEARKYALRVKPEYTVCILKTIEYRRKS